MDMDMDTGWIDCARTGAKNPVLEAVDPGKMEVDSPLRGHQAWKGGTIGDFLNRKVVAALAKKEAPASRGQKLIDLDEIMVIPETPPSAAILRGRTLLRTPPQEAPPPAREDSRAERDELVRVAMDKNPEVVITPVVRGPSKAKVRSSSATWGEELRRSRRGEGEGIGMEAGTFVVPVLPPPKPKPPLVADVETPRRRWRGCWPRWPSWWGRSRKCAGS